MIFILRYNFYLTLIFRFENLFYDNRYNGKGLKPGVIQEQVEFDRPGEHSPE